MKQQELHCLVIRGHVGRYPALIKALRKFSDSIKIELIDNDAMTVKEALQNRKLGLVFLFQESGLSMDALTNILQKNGSEAILVSLNDEKPQSALSVKTGYTGVQVCNLHYKPSGSIANLALKFLLQYAFLKAEFRNCKSLLRVSEQRCHWLVDSSSEAVAYVANDLHLYANQTYVDLLADSLHSLKVTAVSELVLADEREIFFDFVRQYENRSAKASALIVTLCPQSGEVFRASIRLIPTVFSGTRCYQLWVRKLGSGRQPSREEKIEFDTSSSSIELNAIDHHKEFPWSDTLSLEESRVENSVVFEQPKQTKEVELEHPITVKAPLKSKIPSSNKPSIYSKLLKQIVLSNEVSLELSKLDRCHSTDTTTRQYMVDLNVLEREYASVSSVLDKKYHAVFWDQVMLILLFQRLKQAGSKGMKLLIPLTEASLADDWFKYWLGISLSRFNGDVSGCVFLLSLSVDRLMGESSFERLRQQLIKLHCGIGIDAFEINQHTKSILQAVVPEYVRFSKKWVIANIKNNKQVLKLAATIKILEKNKVKVIAPYHSGKKMKQLFNMSGASFCQIQEVKPLSES